MSQAWIRVRLMLLCCMKAWDVLMIISGLLIIGFANCSKASFEACSAVPEMALGVLKLIPGRSKSSARTS